MQQFINSEPEIIKHILKDDGQFPNNGLFLLIYKVALVLPEKDAASEIEKIFRQNNWTNSWQNGIFDYHHYHSNTHEVLGIYEGATKIQFGGPHGVIEEVKMGDVIVIPAGVAHKRVGSNDFKCVGAYPEGKEYDTKYGKLEERPESDENILEVPLPETDPVFGETGPLKLNWEMQ